MDEAWLKIESRFEGVSLAWKLGKGSSSDPWSPMAPMPPMPPLAAFISAILVAGYSGRGGEPGAPAGIFVAIDKRR